jgi:hypothetical protein
MTANKPGRGAKIAAVNRAHKPESRHCRSHGRTSSEIRNRGWIRPNSWRPWLCGEMADWIRRLQAIRRRSLDCGFQSYQELTET